ncbi:type II secretion system protein J [Chloroflexota bacterium]
MKLNGEAGITLTEVLVASTIGLAIAFVVGTAIYQFFVVTSQGNDVVSAVHQVQNAGHWVTRDGQESITATGGDELVLTVPDRPTITYALSGTELTRTSDGSEYTVARHISDVDFYIDGSIVTMNITAEPNDTGDISEQVTYKVCLRPTGGG